MRSEVDPVFLLLAMHLAAELGDAEAVAFLQSFGRMFLRRYYAGSVQ